ncbi:MAG: toll/interleukin-1 receptor domain-containing protein [Acidobacteriaceae bacterium]|nr:toll/interleukin-1 receptor domain-containing protein [Acidobacteriaceae bacterium]
MKGRGSRPRVVRYIDRCVREEGPIELDGAGRFELNNGDVVFQASRATQVFIAYAKEDRAEARKLYRSLKSCGLEPWMDEQKLLPGQNWPRAIERAIEVSDYVLVCFSRRSVGKRGFFQTELRYALDVAACVPLDEIFLLPVRLSECQVPLQIARQTQYIDLFPDWETGIKALATVMTRRTHDQPMPGPKRLD